MIGFQNFYRIVDLRENEKDSDDDAIVISVVTSATTSKSTRTKLRKVEYEGPSMTSQGSRNLCVAWSNNVWSSEFCRLLKSNSTHTSCSCEGFDDVTRFGIVEDSGQPLTDVNKFYDVKGGNNNGGGIFRATSLDDLSTATIVIVAVSASLLVGSLLAAALLVIYCRRVKVRKFLICPWWWWSSG